MSKIIARVVVGLPVEGPFDYIVGGGLKKKISVGCRVRVSFAHRDCIGFVVGLAQRTQYRGRALKPILGVLDAAPTLSSRILKLTREFSQYYGCSWGEAIELSLPKALRSGRVFEETVDFEKKRLNKSKKDIILVHDVSKAKCWEVLIREIKQILQKGENVIFLVPEVILIDQVLHQLNVYFSEPKAVLDKKLSSKKELEQWCLIKKGEARIVVGTRSAIFAPVCRLGLVIVWDEESSFYKQEQAPFYHARDVMLMRSKMSQCSVILTSSAPSTEIWFQAVQKKIKLLSFEERQLSQIQVVDLSNYKSRRDQMFSVPLRNSIQQALEKKRRVILFLNRKGFGTYTSCHQCHFVLRCPRCETNLVYLYSQKRMKCCQCNYTTNLPNICPQCEKSYLHSAGMGIEKLESEVARMFPQARISRYEKTSSRIPEDFDILISTQAILRLVNRLSVEIVGVVQIDAELNRPDFRCFHKVYSLLVLLRQMAGEKIIIQTRFPDNYCISSVMRGYAKEFYTQDIKFRRELKLPPFRHLISVIARAFKEETALEQANSLYQEIMSQKGKKIEISEPQPDIIPKLRGKYRFMIMVKGTHPKQMLNVIRKAIKSSKRKSGVIISVNVDP